MILNKWEALTKGFHAWSWCLLWFKSAEEFVILQLFFPLWFGFFSKRVNSKRLKT